MSRGLTPCKLYDDDDDDDDGDDDGDDIINSQSSLKHSTLVQSTEGCLKVLPTIKDIRMAFYI